MVDLHWTEVDHVTTVWTDASMPLRAGLLFRTGRADETLVTSGQTHLIEHLSLSAVSKIPQNNNGFVGGVVSGFVTVGHPQEVSGFLANLCEALGALPGDRLEGEKQVLAAENASRRYDFHSNLLAWRYGAKGYGLFAMQELGLRKVNLEELQSMASERFTRENAILWLTGPIPDGLHLNLPHGTKQPIPALVPIQQKFPCWFLDNACGGVAVGSVVPRSYAAPIFQQIVSKRLLNRLRSDQALSYAPSVFYDHLDLNTAHLILFADSEKERRKKLANLFGEIFSDLSIIDANELEEARNQILEQYIGFLAPQDDNRKMIEIQRAAMDWIMGDEFESMESIADHYKSVTLDDVTAFTRSVQATAIFALPGEASLLPVFGKQAISSIVAPVQGRKTTHRDSPVRPEKLIYGPEGVSIVRPKGPLHTVRYSDLAAAICFPDGGIHLVGNDSTAIMVEPNLWRGGEAICRKIREQVPAWLIIDEPARSEKAIPKPSTTAWQRFIAWVDQHGNFGATTQPKNRLALRRVFKIFYWGFLAAMILGFLNFILWIFLY